MSLIFLFLCQVHWWSWLAQLVVSAIKYFNEIQIVINYVYVALVCIASVPLGSVIISLSTIEICCAIKSISNHFTLEYIFIPHEQRSCGGVYWFHSVRPSVRPSIRLSRLPCPLCNIYSSGWIPSILATNDHYHERVCGTQWPLTLTYIFKVIWPWLRKSCPLCSIYDSGWILFIFGTNDHYHQRVCCVFRFFRIWKFEFLPNFRNFWALTLKKKSTVLDRFFPYLAQMITSMRGCVACNDLWPWTISSRSFGLGLENRVRSVASTVLDGFFPYLI